MRQYELIQGDCLERMREMADNSFDAIVTDSPYGISFMSKRWDYDVPNVDIWREALRVLKPGGHLLSFFGTRTYHRGVVNIEDAGFEIRDQIQWLYGSGFPKSLDVSKQIDRMKGAEREVIGKKDRYLDGKIRQNLGNANNWGGTFGTNGVDEITAPATDEAKQWNGFGTALKPACEPIVLARKPLEKGLSVAENVLKWGTGALNIDGCRIGTEERTYKGMSANVPAVGTFRDDNWKPKDIEVTVTGRFPANVIHDGSDEVLEEFAKYGERKSGANKLGGIKRQDNNILGKGLSFNAIEREASTGTAARFFYAAKASKRDRDEGLEGFEEKTKRIYSGGITSADHPETATGGGDRQAKNTHPTVKPTSLMQYLCRLVTPPNGKILDPFCGSGSTGKAAMIEGFRFVGIDREAEYLEIAKARIEAALNREPLLAKAA